MLDAMGTLDIIRTINSEDKTVPDVVGGALPAIAAAVDAVTASLRSGGRLIYVGAGTAGRLGCLDAAECVPTFGISPGTVIPVIAGGSRAFMSAVEGAEDCRSCGAARMSRLKVGPADFVMAVVASGKAPFVLGAMERAKGRGAGTGAIVNIRNAAVSQYCGFTIELLVGPEVIAGSSRMKAGMAEKLVLNMISTAAFVRLGRVYGNLMVGLKPLNSKIRERSVRILSTITGSTHDEAEGALAGAGWDIRVASLMLLKGLEPKEARRRLESAQWSLRAALG